MVQSPKIRRDILLFFALPIDMFWGAAVLLWILYRHLAELSLTPRPPETIIPSLNMGPVAIAILGASFGAVLGPVFGQIMYRRRSDRVANFMSAASLLLGAVFGLLRYGFTTSIIIVNETFSDYFIAILIVVVLITSAFPVLHYLARPDPRAIRSPFSSRRGRRRPRSTRQSPGSPRRR